MVLLQRRDYSKMAASLLTKLERQFECELCLESLNDPRELVCRHTYCRSCLDDLLKFDSNGNATIKCPNNCDDKTLIGCNDTTKILRKNRELLKILDLMKEENKSQNTDGATCKCKASISRWCTGCRLMFCKNCYQTHDCVNNSCINGYYSLVNETFQPLCEQHDAHIKHICLGCDHRFICCYCRNRDHRSHQVNTLEESANKYKQGFLDDLDKINGDALNFSYDDVITNVFKFEEDLTMELNSRIHLKVSSYIQKLNKEKEEILSQYKQAASNYKLSLNGLQFSHKTIKESLDSAKKSLKQQSPFETLALKADLIRQIESITKLNVFKVSIDEDENSDSLGTLKTEILKKDLSEGNFAFDHDINLKNKDDYVDIVNESKFLIEDLQKKSTRLLITNVEEKYYLRYNTKGDRREDRGGFDRRDDRGGDRGGFDRRGDRGGDRGGFDRRGWDRREDRGGFDRRDDRGGDRGGFDRRGDRGGDRGGFDRRGWDRREDRGGFDRRDDRGGDRGGFDRRGDRGGDRGGFDRRGDRGGDRGGFDRRGCMVKR